MNSNKYILIVDDDSSTREVLSMVLEEWGYSPLQAKDGEDALKKLGEKKVTVVLTDLVMPRIDGLELLNQIKKISPKTRIILMTAQGTIDLAVEAMKQGAVDFLTKPVDFKKLKILLENLLADDAELAELEDLNAILQSGGSFHGIVGQSAAIHSVFQLIKDVGPKHAAVLITGESGTGKEVVARAIHDISPRSDGPFIAVNASAIPESLIESEVFGHERGAFTGAVDRRLGCFEQANKGTLFMDEIAEMPINLQPKLLRVLEENSIRRVGGRESIPIDVRIVAATNHRPEKAIQEGKLRKDLFYRLGAVQIDLPPLSERKDDIPLLTRHFIELYNQKHHCRIKFLSRRAKQIFMNYTWPGNIRELRNVIERGVIVAKSEWIEPQDLPPYLAQVLMDQEQMINIKAGTPFSEAEKEIILRTLKSLGNNKAEAARVLGVDVKTIRNKLKAYGISDLDAGV